MDDKYPRLESRRLANLRVVPDLAREASPGARHILGLQIAALDLIQVGIVFNVRTGNLVGGRLVVLALRDLGKDEAPVWCVDLTREQEEVASIALNSHAGEWQWEQLSKRLQAMGQQNVAVCGLPSHLTEPLKAADWTPSKELHIDGEHAAQGSLL